MEFPSEGLICKLAKVLDAEENEIWVQAEKIPSELKKRIMQRPEAFMAFAALDDESNAVVRKIPVPKRTIQPH